MEDSGEDLDERITETENPKADGAAGGDEKELKMKDGLDRLRKLVQLQPINEKQYKVKYEELKKAFWMAQEKIQDEYDFGMIKLDCRKFKNQVVTTIG